MESQKITEIEEKNLEILEYKLAEMERASFMGLLKRVAQTCFSECVQKIDGVKLTDKEKICLNACYTVRVSARAKLIDTGINEK